MPLVVILFVVFAYGLFLNIQKAGQGRMVYAADWFATIVGTAALGWAIVEWLSK